MLYIKTNLPLHFVKTHGALLFTILYNIADTSCDLLIMHACDTFCDELILLATYVISIHCTVDSPVFMKYVPVQFLT